MYNGGITGGERLKKNRAYVDVYRDILSACMDGRTRTGARRGCRIDTARMRHYLDDCLQAGLLEERRVRELRHRGSPETVFAVMQRRLFTTEKGREYLKTYERLIGLLSPS